MHRLSLAVASGDCSSLWCVGFSLWFQGRMALARRELDLNSEGIGVHFGPQNRIHHGVGIYC